MRTNIVIDDDLLDEGAIRVRKMDRYEKDRSDYKTI